MMEIIVDAAYHVDDLMFLYWTRTKMTYGMRIG